MKTVTLTEIDEQKVIRMLFANFVIYCRLRRLNRVWYNVILIPLLLQTLQVF